AQAYPKTGTTADANDPTLWEKCTAAATDPKTAGGAPYCDDANKHFGAYSEASWANGGSKPFIFPWIALPQIGFRWKPIKQFETRFDFGFSTSGFFLGLAASYGL